MVLQTEHDGGVLGSGRLGGRGVGGGVAGEATHTAVHGVVVVVRIQGGSHGVVACAAAGRGKGVAEAVAEVDHPLGGVEGANAEGASGGGLVGSGVVVVVVAGHKCVGGFFLRKKPCFLLVG
jgi:hypothetical protein